MRIETLLGACSFAVLLGCTQTGTGTDDSGRGPGSTPVVVDRLPAIDGVDLRRADGGYEIEIQSTRGFPPRSFDWVLTIGTTKFETYHYSPTIGTGGVVYPLSSAEFDALVDGSLVSVLYGSHDQRPRTFGPLDKSAALQ